MLLDILFFPFKLIGWVFSGVFGLVGGIFSFLFGLVGGAITLVLALGMIVGGIALCATIIGAIFGAPLLLLGVLLLIRAIIH